MTYFWTTNNWSNVWFGVWTIYALFQLETKFGKRRIVWTFICQFSKEIRSDICKTISKPDLGKLVQGSAKVLSVKRSLLSFWVQLDLSRIHVYTATELTCQLSCHYILFSCRRCRRHHPKESRPSRVWKGWNRMQTNTLITRRSRSKGILFSCQYV